MSLYLSWLRASPNAANYRTWQQSLKSQKLNTLLGIPLFDISGLPWVGATYIATEFWGLLSGVFSLRVPQIQPSSFNFFLAIRTPQQNSDGLNVTRYKLWEPPEIVRLDTFPVYAEQRLNGPFAIEVWTLPSSDRVSISEVQYLITSLILDPVTCCCDPPVIITLTEHCGIWATQNIAGNYNIPIVFNTCVDALPVDTFFRVIENGDIRAINGDQRVYV